MTTLGSTAWFRRAMRRSVPPESSRTSGPCSSISATAWARVRGRAYANGVTGSEHLLDLIDQRLGLGGSDEEVRTRREPLDEGSSSRAKLGRVQQRHRQSRSQELVEQEVVLEAVEGLELALERDHLGDAGFEVAVDRGNDHDVDVGDLVVLLHGRHVAEEERDSSFGARLVRSLGPLGSF